MNIGNKIYELRTARNISQEELASILEVSRQSVSKWETGSALPEIDKLIKICNTFNVSLDELTGREVPKAIPNSNDNNAKKPSSPQKIIGYILFTFSLLCGLFILFFAVNEGDFLILMPISTALLVCGLLCIFAGNKAFYWCIWTAFAPLCLLTPYIVGFPILSSLTSSIIVISVIAAFVANKVFKDVFIKPDKRRSVVLILSWLLPLFIYALNMFLMSRTDVVYNPLIFVSLNFICYALVAGLDTYTVIYIKSFNKTAG